MRGEAVRSLALHKAGVPNEIRLVIERDTHLEVRKVANFFLK
jgi:hypothetical protein